MISFRCADCLTDFAPDEDRFAVLKQLRDPPADATPWEREFLTPMLFDQVFVCGGCSRTYPDPICLSAETRI